MSRRHSAQVRNVLPDVKYGSVFLTKFINNIMESGKKALAEKIVYGALDLVNKKHKMDSMEAFNNAVANVRPGVEVTSVRVGGANYQVPSVVDARRGDALAIRWLINFASKRSEKTMREKLAEEIFEAANGRGGSVKKREDTHKMAEANRAFAHFAVKKGGGR
jgi:small subunit ribosomal protein S7